MAKKPKKPERTTVTLEIPTQLRDDLRALADREGRKIRVVATRAIQAEVTRAAIEDAAAKDITREGR